MVTWTFFKLKGFLFSLEYHIKSALGYAPSQASLTHVSTKLNLLLALYLSNMLTLRFQH